MGEEIVLSPHSDMDMAVYELCCGCSVTYNANCRLTPEELLWCLFSVVPCCCLFIALVHFFPDRPGVELNNIITFSTVFSIVWAPIQFIILVYLSLNNYRYPYSMFFRSVGPKAKFMINFVPALIATVLHHRLYLNNNHYDDDWVLHLLEFNYEYLFLLLGCTGYLYVILHFTRRAYDISGKDVLLGFAMQIFCFMVNGVLFVRVMALSLCFGLSLYRYITYSAPALPPHPKMEEPINSLC